jgi:hypothetical protein
MQKTCTQCQASFEITKEDLAFYEKVSPTFNGTKYSIPSPTLCPDCRYRRRLAFRNERSLYRRTCDMTGKEMIAMHPPDTPFPVYHITEWMSDKWDPLDYGREYDYSRSFFEQFKELCDSVPHFSAFVDPQMDQNAEYTNCSSEARNCYMITQAEKNEDCYYSRGINQCKNCCDCLRVQQCELCYEVIYGTNCYRCFFCQDIWNSSDCFFSSDLRSCKHCFGCHGLSQKEYHIFNEPVSKEEWQEKAGSLTLTHEIIGEMKKRSEQTRLKTPQRAVHTIQCEDCVGDHIVECRGSSHIFDSANLEHCTYVYEVANGAKDCMDYSMWGINCELLYECNGCGYNVQRCLFCNHCWQGVSDLLYCESCFPSVRNCFGCFGLRRAEYCILNKKYGKEEYGKLISRIVEHMQKTPLRSSGATVGQAGEWGEFFPVVISPYTYEESLDSEFFPAEERSEEARPFEIIPQEKRLLKKLGIPLPQKSPATRHKERMQKRNPRKLWKRECGRCGSEIQTTYSPERPEIVYCEECYLKEVY